jgi:hypothetical protein
MIRLGFGYVELGIIPDNDSANLCLTFCISQGCSLASQHAAMAHVMQDSLTMPAGAVYLAHDLKKFKVVGFPRKDLKPHWAFVCYQLSLRPV